jgi:hypothetical protein
VRITSDSVFVSGNKSNILVNDTGIISNNRIKQILKTGSSWENSVNGYYALAKKVTPLPKPSSAGVKAVKTWTTRTIEMNPFQSICWSPELALFVVVAASGTNQVATSIDGITWVPRNAASSESWSGVTWSSKLSLFVAVASSGAGIKAMWSNNGINWNSATSIPQVDNLRSVVWAEELGIFVAIGGNGAMSSTDGKTWTIVSIPEHLNWMAISWSPELRLFVAVAAASPIDGFNAGIMTSTTGTSDWTMQTNPAEISTQWRGVCWSSELGLFVACAGNGLQRIATSPDGIIWTLRNTGNNAINSVAWSPELGIFVAPVYQKNLVLASFDGIIWTEITGLSINNDNDFTSVCWSPELGIFAACAGSGTNRIITSSLKGRPPTSYNYNDNPYFNVNENNEWSIGYNTQSDIKIVNLGRPLVRGDLRFLDVVTPFSNQTQLYQTGNQFSIVSLNNNSQIGFSNKDSSGNAINTFRQSIFSTTITSGETIFRSTDKIGDAGLRIVTDSSNVYLQPYTLGSGGGGLKNLHFTTFGSLNAHLGIDSSDGSVVIGTNNPASGCKLTIKGKTQTDDLNITNILSIPGYNNVGNTLNDISNNYVKSTTLATTVTDISDDVVDYVEQYTKVDTQNILSHSLSGNNSVLSISCGEKLSRTFSTFTGVTGITSSTFLSGITLVNPLDGGKYRILLSAYSGAKIAPTIAFKLNIGGVITDLTTSNSNIYKNYGSDVTISVDNTNTNVSNYLYLEIDYMGFVDQISKHVLYVRLV